MPMQLGFSAWAMAQMPVAEQIALVREPGYMGIELVSDPRSSLDAQRTGADERQRIRRLLDEAGLALPSIAGHGNLLEPDAKKRAAQLARVQAAIDLAVDLAGPDGPPCVVTMAYGRPAQYEQVRETVAEHFGGLARDLSAAMEDYTEEELAVVRRWLEDMTGVIMRHSRGDP